ncbi:MAG: hypothetical protein RLZZ176_2374, partial [Cyanobacteriota bacterium]
YLLAYFLKKWGWVLLIFGAVLGLIVLILDWEPDVFPEVCQLIRELKGTFSEIGFYREPKTVDRLYTPMLA